MRSKLLIGGIAAVAAFLLATNSLVAQAAAFITSADIVNDTIKSKDVKNNALKGKDVKDNSLKGADIDESTLVGVNADKVDGVDSQALVQKATVRTEQNTCSGTTFFPINDTQTWNTSASRRYSTDSALVRCNVDLPVNAVVRSVSFTIADTDAAENLFCEMWRTDLANGSESQMASTSSTGTPGNSVITDSSVASATVDATHAYFVQCDLGTTSAVGLYASSVVYDANAAGTALGRPGPEATTGSSTD